MIWAIYKYDLGDAPGLKLIGTHKGAKILSAQLQGKTVVLWAQCAVSAPTVRRKIRLCMTGEEIPSAVVNHCKFVSTVQLQLIGGVFVLHIFDCGETA